MSSSPWLPFEWPSVWRDPSALKILEGTPFNCILFAPDAPAPLRQAAESRGFACPANIAWRPLKDVEWNAPGDLVAISDAVWPELALRTHSKDPDGADAGPTGAPWLDANGWLIQLARARAQRKTVWIRSDPPEKLDGFGFGNCELANSEAAAYGARRPLWLAPALATALAQSQTQATEDWKRLVASIRWHKDHSEWASWPVVAQLLIVSDFSGSNEYNSTETLNLSSRRNLAYLPVETSRFEASLLKGRRAVLYIDPQPMPAPMAAAVQSFVESGGLLLCLKEPAAVIRNTRPSSQIHPRFEMLECGKGIVAVSKTEWEDTFILAEDAHLIMSRRYDAVRLFNAGSLGMIHTTAPAAKRWLVQLINYSARGAAHEVSLQTWHPIASARFLSPGQAAPVPLEIHQEATGREIYIPRFSVYSAIELELASQA